MEFSLQRVQTHLPVNALILSSFMNFGIAVRLMDCIRYFTTASLSRIVKTLAASYSLYWSTQPEIWNCDYVMGPIKTDCISTFGSLHSGNWKISAISDMSLPGRGAFLAAYWTIMSALPVRCTASHTIVSRLFLFAIMFLFRSYSFPWLVPYSIPY